MSNNPIDYSTTVVASTMQVSSELGAEIVIMDLARGIYHGVEGVAAAVWTMLTLPHSVEQICLRVMDEYDVEADRCEIDIVNLLESLLVKGLIDVVPTPAQLPVA